MSTTLEDLEILKKRFNLSDDDFNTVKNGFIQQYIDATIKKQPRNKIKYGKLVSNDIENSINEFFSLNETKLKYYNKEKLDFIKIGADLVFNTIPEKRITGHKKRTNENHHYDNITEILWLCENLEARLKEL